MYLTPPAPERTLGQGGNALFPYAPHVFKIPPTDHFSHTFMEKIWAPPVGVRGVRIAFLRTTGPMGWGLPLALQPA